MSSMNSASTETRGSKLKRDILLVLGIVLFAAVLLAALLIFRSEGDVAVVSVSGEELFRVDLSKDSVTPIRTDLGYNLLVVEDGEAYVKEASCPDKICVHHRRISFSGESIVCLPNEVTVRIVRNDGGAVDAVS